MTCLSIILVSLRSSYQKLIQTQLIIFIMAKKTISISVEEKLKALYDLQCVDSEIDQLRIVRGELPVEIQDLEDEIIRLESN